MKIDTDSALQYFKQHDPIMAELLLRALEAPQPIAIPKPKPTSQYFSSIVSSIISQQISTKAATAVRQRVLAQLGTLTPEAVNAVDFDSLKACGLSAQKTKYIKHNASVWPEIPVGDFVHLPDEAIIAELTTLYGIGRWTAEMFMIFSLARPDVFSYGDFGLMKSVYRHYNYKPHYVRKLRSTVAGWAPHRTVASLTLWHQLDNGPVLL
jgi:DNA-3-methyladenine glycosylase II